MRLHKISLIVLLLTFQETQVMADNEFEESIPLDVAAALFDYGETGNFAVYSDIMDDFPVFQIPDGFTVLGSAFFINQMRVALSTELGVEEAAQSIEDSFTSDDWGVMPNFDPGLNRTGFVSANQVESRRRSICHDEFGQLTIATRTHSAGNQVILSGVAGMRRNWGTCAQLRAQMEEQLSMMQNRGSLGIQQYMPRLLIPEDSNSGLRPAYLLGGMSSSGNKTETDIELEIAWDLEEIYSHFAKQMADLEWVLDAESVGSVSASGTWTQNPEAGMSIMGTLNVASLGEDRFQLKLTVEVLGGGGGSRGSGAIFRN